MTSLSAPRRQITMVTAGVPLAMCVVFTGLERLLGTAGGYLVGFGVYWLTCVAVAVALLGARGAASTWREQKPTFRRDNALGVALLVMLTAGAVGGYGAEFLDALLTRPSLVAVVVPLAVTNGVLEELLWRGVPLRLSHGDRTWGVVIPSAGFALWHVAPQLLFPSENVASFVVATFFLGLASGVVAIRSGSIRFSALSHAVNGILALGGALAPAALDVFRAG